MAKLGILLACDHYPTVSADARRIDSQLRLWLASYGAVFDEIEVFATHEGALPRHAAECDAWIVSGAPLEASQAGQRNADALRQFLRAAASFRRPIFAINHAEHVVHAALAAFDAPAPASAPLPRSIQNPFRSFHGRYALYRFNPATRRVDVLPRPSVICPRRMFGVLRRAA